MTCRIPGALAVFLGLAFANTATAQPVVPPRPTFSAYPSVFYPGGGYYGYGQGFGSGPGSGFGFGRQVMQQNQLLQQQLNQTNQGLNNLQSLLVAGLVPSIGSVTGHQVTFNSLGHWYPLASNGGGGGLSGLGFGRGMNNSRLAGSGGAGSGIGKGPAGAGGIGGPPTTAGNGVPLGR